MGTTNNPWFMGGVWRWSPLKEHTHDDGGTSKILF